MKTQMISTIEKTITAGQFVKVMNQFGVVMGFITDKVGKEWWDVYSLKGIYMGRFLSDESILVEGKVVNGKVYPVGYTI